MDKKTVRALLIYTLFYFLLFLLGIALLKVSIYLLGNNSQAFSGRLSTSFFNILSMLKNDEYRGIFLTEIYKVYLFISVNVFLIFLVCGNWKKISIIKYLFATLVLLSPVVLILSVETLAYEIHSIKEFGFFWPPRLCIILTSLLSVSIFALFYLKNEKKNNKWITLFAIIASVIFQFNFLEYFFEYRVLSRVNREMITPIITTKENNFLNCLSSKFGRSTSVLSSSFLFGKFHMQNIIWCHSDLSNKNLTPEIVICNPKLPLDFHCVALGESFKKNNGYEYFSVDNLQIYHNNTLKRTIQSCLGN
ncbi:MAG: hypothetical protein HQK53_12495 [Oligoflexia bacterium]|nr:hypothetical protein [Oligoflexia bacterium]